MALLTNARVGLRQPGIVGACPDQKRTAAGQGLQVDVGANVLGPWMFGECRSAEQSRFLAAIEVHDNGAIERRFTGQHAQRLDDASNSGSVVGRADRVSQRVEVSVEKNGVAALAR